VHALADLAVLEGDDTGAPLDLDTAEIAAQFVELYWRQVRPFQVGGEDSGLVLRQNRGRQAAIVSKIAEAQPVCGGSVFQLKQCSSDRWAALVAEVDQVVRTMPLWKLQSVEEERLEFFYENLHRGSRITLKPGVAFCLRSFYELVRNLIERAWGRYVQRVNAEVLGQVSDLGGFLFGQERASLDAYRTILLDVRGGVCLYCRKPLTRRAQVDHFIPWSLFPADLGHNFVLAHEGCIGAKSDHLAAEEHLAAWARRNREHRAELDARLSEAPLPCDVSAAVQVARWVYQQTEKADGQVWVVERVMRHLGPSWSLWLGPVPRQ
jgi:5-methylcytosine-specific restriction endonuclease McrA